MAKINAIFGKGTGKCGPLVFQINGGVQIMKEKAAKVNNPQTDAQIEQRAKLKLMSQLAAAFAPAIAIKKDGLKSARNQFVSRNIGDCTFANDKASIDLTTIKLTNSDANKVNVEGGAIAQGQITLSGNVPDASGIEKVVLVTTKINEDGSLSIVAIAIADVAADHTYTQAIACDRSGGYYYAYGVKFANSAAKSKFENYVATATPTTATLDVVGAMSASIGDAQGTTGVKFE